HRAVPGPRPDPCVYAPLHRLARPERSWTSADLHRMRVTAIASRFRHRQHSAGVQAHTADGMELTVSSALSLSRFFQDRFQVHRQPCRGDEGDELYCLEVRGYAMPMAVYLDGLIVPGGATVLDLYTPGDMYRVEVYPMLR